MFFTVVLTCAVYAQATGTGTQNLTGKYLSMAVAVGVACIGAGYAVGKTTVAAAATITEKPELFGRTIVYLGMAEGIAIYGLLIAFLIWIT
jgi:V/A-type H+-transporting ATPase subunit K